MPITFELSGEKIYPNYLHWQFSTICVYILIKESKITQYHCGEKLF